MCRSEKWEHIIGIVKDRQERRIKAVEDVAKELTNRGQDKMADEIRLYQMQLCRHLMDFTKDNLKTDIMGPG